MRCQRSGCCQRYHLILNVADINNSEDDCSDGSHLKIKGQSSVLVFAKGLSLCHLQQATQVLTSRFGGPEYSLRVFKQNQTQKQQIPLCRLFLCEYESAAETWSHIFHIQKENNYHSNDVTITNSGNTLD